jgi:uncharacterized membrane protein
METDRPPGTGRLEAFSDGVVAIIVTIMVLELRLPDDLFTGGHLQEALAAFWPRLVVYALSFLVVAIMLINHHLLMRAAPYSTTPLYWWNANLLFWMSLIPLSTGVLGNAPSAPGAVAAYGLVLTAASLGFTLLHRCAALIGSKTGELAPIHRAIVKKDAFFTTLYALSVPLAFISIYISILIFAIIPAAYFFPEFVPWPQSWQSQEPSGRHSRR